MAADYDIKAAFTAIENELLRSMIRNMKEHRAEEDKRGYQWAQWQAMQVYALNEYKRNNKDRFAAWYKDINSNIRLAILRAHATGKMVQEEGILKAIRNGFTGYKKPSDKMVGEFFRVNERSLNALIDATVSDMERAETAILRMHDDKVRKVIFNAQVYANTGAATYEKAVDMAVKDYAYAGINCVRYKDGKQVNIKDYADMALRTARKRAYLTGEGQMRQKWGIHTVVMHKRSNPCPLCLPWVGKILVDDVWSGGTKEEAEQLHYPAMSTAVAAGLYHPNCRDSHTTYMPGISTPPNHKWTKEELSNVQAENSAQAKAGYAKRQAEKCGRVARCALDKDTKNEWTAKEKRWKEKAKEQKEIANAVSSDIMGLTHRIKRSGSIV